MESWSGRNIIYIHMYKKKRPKKGHVNHKNQKKIFNTFLINNLQDASYRVFEIRRTYRTQGQKIMRSANNVGPHVRQKFLNDVFTFLTEVRNAGRIVNTGTSSVNSEFVTTLIYAIFYLFLVNIIGNCQENKYI